MKHLIVNTPDGPLYLTGRLQADRTRPALFVMGGVWAPEDLLHEVVDWFPDHTVLVALFPGMKASRTKAFDTALMSRMVDAAIATLLPGVPVVAFGGSTGALVMLALQSPQVVRFVAMEPFFATAHLWPLRQFVERFVIGKPEAAGAAKAAEGLFGFSEKGFFDRDYRGVLPANKPVDVIFGGQPLEPEREIGDDPWPSLTSAEDRAWLATQPLVTLHPGPADAGHYFQQSPAAAQMLKTLLDDVLARAANAPPAVGSERQSPLASDC